MTIKENLSIDKIRDEIRHLVDIHTLSPQQAVYTLSQFFSPGEWNLVECELEANGYSLMTNCIGDVLDKES